MRFSSCSKISISLSLLVVFAASLAMLVSARSIVRATSPGITLSINAGPPTTVTMVHGTGFKGRELITLAFDTTQLASITSSTSGTFSVSLPVPKSAQPGRHPIQALDQTRGSVAQARFLVQTNWAEFGFNQRNTRFNPNENVLTSSNVSGLTLDWIYPGGFYNASSPAVANGVAYVGSGNGYLYALDAATGALKWKYRYGAGYSSPAVVNGLVYIGSGDGKLYALDASTGTLKWSRASGCGPVAVAEGVVYANAGNLYALDALTGALKWSYPTGGWSSPHAPVVANGVIYISDSLPDGKLYALDARKGTLLWSNSATLWNEVDSSLAVVNGVVYGTSTNNILYAFHLLGRTP